MNAEFTVTRELAEAIVGVARSAGVEILKIYETDFEVRSKSDASPVTEADETAERLILGELARLAPGIPVIAEESYARGDRPDISGGIFWLVDALDGTKEFVSRNGEFTVNIALIENGVPVFGVVHAPARDVTYWGGADGAYASAGEEDPRPISVRPEPADGLVVLTSRTHRSAEADFLEDVNVKAETHAGSSIKFCLLAAGKADLYPRLGPTSEWDTAAGHAVLLAAGGRVEKLDGTALVYGKEDILNPEFVARGGLA